MGARSSPSRPTVTPQPPPPDRPGRHQNLAIARSTFLKFVRPPGRTLPCGRKMPNPVRRLSYIDALRGYAILMVIAVHSSQAFSDLPKPLSTILNQGARGVQLFFVTSALTLSMSWVSRKESALAFYLLRFFRIAPMFLLWVPFFVLLPWSGSA